MKSAAKEDIQVQDPTALRSYGTESYEKEGVGLSGRLGQALMVVSGAALVALAARDRSWRSLGVAAAGAPLLYRGATGQWPVPRAVAQRAAEAVASAPVETSITIGQPRQEVYQFWRQLENLPLFMRNLESVTDLGDGRSRWVAKAPLGLKAEWDAEIVEEIEGQMLSWCSLPGSQVETAGTVLFEDATGGRGTVVRVSLDYRVSGIGQAVGKLLSPLTKQEVHMDLRRLKELLETGEIPTTEGQPAGSRPAINIHSPF